VHTLKPANTSGTSSLQTLVDGLRFPESPRWHDGRLWFSDFFQRCVFSVSELGVPREELQLADSPSGLGWDPEGNLIVVSMHDRRLLTQRGRALQELANLSVHTGGHCNDLLVDEFGRCYVGNFGFDLYAGHRPRPTCLLRVDPDRSVHRAAEQLWFPNGMALTPDGATLIVAETYAHRLTAFNVEPSGGLSNRRVFAELPALYPDGICLDVEGAVWVADARGNRVLRIKHGVGIVRTISTGSHRAYACMLGGHDGQTLFVCTASGIGPMTAQVHDGRIEFARVDVPHAGRP